MAVQDLFKEVKDALSNYADEHYYAYVKSQSERYVTRMHYTDKWCIDALKKNFASAINSKSITLSTMERSQLNSIIEGRTKIENTISNWTMALNPYFTIVPSSQKTNLDGTVQILNNSGGSGVEVRFHKSFTMGEFKGGAVAGPFPDKHETAQKQFFKHIAEKIQGDVQRNPTFSQDSKNNIFGLEDVAKGNFRLHAGDKRQGRNDDTGYKSDTTVRLIDFLEDIKKKNFDAIIGEDKTKRMNTKIVMDKVNEKFNAGFSIDGISKIDLFDGEIDKNIAIKVVFGHSSQNSLAQAADKGNYSTTDKRLDGFFASLEQSLLDEFAGDEGKTTSLSMGEMMRRGVFAKVAKEMKTASGMPDMRFKINKQLVKEANYKDKQKGKKSGVNLQKSKKTRVKTISPKVGKGKIRTRSDQSMRTADNPLALEALLNELLPRVVASKMTSPALNYRTGRFANSARVEDVMVGPRGGLAINYTYMRDPYETFEPGNAQGSVQRDPRKILGESVREVAQSIIGDRFLRVRRV